MENLAGLDRRPPAGLISDFMRDLQEPRTPYISSERFAKRLGLRQAGLARVAGVHRNTLRNNPASEALQSRYREMIKVIFAASEITGDLNKAVYWFMNEPIADYRNKTAIELVADGHADAVLAYIEDLMNGSTG